MININTHLFISCTRALALVTRYLYTLLIMANVNMNVCVILLGQQQIWQNWHTHFMILLGQPNWDDIIILGEINGTWDT